METRIKIRCECGRALLVDPKFIGRTVNCPSCGTGRIKVGRPDPRKSSMPQNGSKELPPISNVSLMAPDSQSTTDGLRKINWKRISFIFAGLTAVLSICLAVTVSKLLRLPSELPPSAETALPTTHLPSEAPAEKDESNPTDDNAVVAVSPSSGAELTEIAPAEPPKQDIPKMAPEEIVKAEFKTLHAAILEIENNFNVETASVRTEAQKILSEDIKLAEDGVELLDEIQEARNKKVAEFRRTLTVHEKKHELRVATVIQEYDDRLLSQGVPIETALKYEQNVIREYLLSQDETSESARSIVERMQKGGDSVLTTRQGRFWVLYGVKLTLQ